MIGLQNELDYFREPIKKYMDIYVYIDEIRKFYGLKKKPVVKSYNSGVIVVDREHSFVFRAPKQPFPDHWCAEQNWLTICVEDNNIPVFELDHHWNCCWAYYRQGTVAYSEAYFIHLNGLSPYWRRLKALKNLSDFGRIEKYKMYL